MCVLSLHTAVEAIVVFVFSQRLQVSELNEISAGAGDLLSDLHVGRRGGSGFSSLSAQAVRSVFYRD